MPKLNVHKLLKKDLIWLATHYCRHGHQYLVHQNCYITEKPDTSPFEERVGFFDIEAADLNAQYGFMLSYCLKPLDEKKILGRAITAEELESKDLDKQIIKEARDDLKKFDRIVVHWGKDRRYDIPFVRSRALKHRLSFPEHKEILVQDTWDMSKTKLCLRTNGLAAIARFLDISAKNHPIDPDTWVSAIVRHEHKALDYILTHNKEDVVATEKVWKRLVGFVAKTKTSI